ncbi:MULTISPECIES: hypothetical protein [unclassified Moorena]|nr:MULTISPECIES: hypothetical protein [unclassified Moorena]
MRLTLAFWPRYANGHALRCSVRAATRSHPETGLYTQSLLSSFG